MDFVFLGSDHWVWKARYHDFPPSYLTGLTWMCNTMGRYALFGTFHRSASDLTFFTFSLHNRITILRFRSLITRTTSPQITPYPLVSIKDDDGLDYLAQMPAGMPRNLLVSQSPNRNRATPSSHRIDGHVKLFEHELLRHLLERELALLM
jgi:hypothetical protein